MQKRLTSRPEIVNLVGDKDKIGDSLLSQASKTNPTLFYTYLAKTDLTHPVIFNFRRRK